MPSAVRELRKLATLDAPELMMESRDPTSHLVLPDAALEVHTLERVALIVLDHNFAAKGPLHRLTALARKDRDESQVLALVGVLPKAVLSEPCTLAARPLQAAHKADAPLARVPVACD